MEPNDPIKPHRDAQPVPDTDKKPSPSHEHLDPLTGAPGAHPIGTGIGAAGAGAAGAAIGAAGGPVGAIAGAAIGAIVGGLVGKGVAEGIDPTAQSAYWRETVKDRPYYDQGFNYDTDYEPAYRHGWEARDRYRDQTFEDAESDIHKEWESGSHSSRLTWHEARPAIKDAWHRIEGKK